jgi:serine/alanine adding enzyme
MLVIKDYREIERNQWSEFVASHPHGNIFHAPEMFDLYNSDEKNEPVFLAVLNSETKICGLLIAYIHAEYRGFVGKFTSRAITWGGPLVTNQNPDIAGLLLDEFDNICRKKTVYSQFRNLWDCSSYKNILDRGGYNFEDHLNFLFDLNKGEEYLWNKISATRKKQINRSTKREVKTKVIDNIAQADLESCYSILKLVYKFAKLPYPDIEFFQRANNILGSCGYLKAIIATLHGKIIGFRFFLCYEGLLYDWYAGSLPEHHDKYPNDILPWKLIKWGADNEYKTFDFGGAGKPDIPYGVRDFKQKFGGDLVNFGRFEKVNKPFHMQIAKAGFKVWKLLR